MELELILKLIWKHKHARMAKKMLRGQQGGGAASPDAKSGWRSSDEDGTNDTGSDAGRGAGERQKQPPCTEQTGKEASQSPTAVGVFQMKRCRDKQTMLEPFLMLWERSECTTLR